MLFALQLLAGGETLSDGFCFKVPELNDKFPVSMQAVPDLLQSPTMSARGADQRHQVLSLLLQPLTAPCRCKRKAFHLVT